HRIVQHRAVAPVGADKRRLPRILDGIDIPAAQEGVEVLFHRRLDRQGPLGERRAAIAIEARLAGVYADHDQADAVRGGQDRSDVGDGDWHWTAGVSARAGWVAASELAATQG